MKNKIYSLVIALFMLGISGSAQIDTDPFYKYISDQTIKLELEEELFGFQNNNEEIISILSLDIYEVEEELELNFNTADYLPANFNAEKGMNKLNWNKIPLYEVEEELDLNLNSINIPEGIIGLE